jgi:hypothetical protein
MTVEGACGRDSFPPRSHLCSHPGSARGPSACPHPALAGALRPPRRLPPPAPPRTSPPQAPASRGARSAAEVSSYPPPPGRSARPQTSAGTESGWARSCAAVATPDGRSAEVASTDRPSRPSGWARRKAELPACAAAGRLQRRLEGISANDRYHVRRRSVLAMRRHRRDSARTGVSARRFVRRRRAPRPAHHHLQVRVHASLSPSTASFGQVNRPPSPASLVVDRSPPVAGGGGGGGE